jgi:serine/threonine protein kinase
VLAGLNHPFLMKMHYSFQDAKKLYFVLEYCPGGELFELLRSRETISEEQYACGVI